MPKTYKCLQCDKTFKKKNYHLKHVRNQHQFFQCEICSQHIKEGSRTVHIMRCKRREQLKTTRCLICHQNFLFENILYHLKNTHKVWEHIKISPRPTARSPLLVIYEDKGLQVENGRIAPPQHQNRKCLKKLRNCTGAKKLRTGHRENSRTADRKFKNSRQYRAAYGLE